MTPPGLEDNEYTQVTRSVRAPCRPARRRSRFRNGFAPKSSKSVCPSPITLPGGIEDEASHTRISSKSPVWVWSMQSIASTLRKVKIFCPLPSRR